MKIVALVLALIFGCAVAAPAGSIHRRNWSPAVIPTTVFAVYQAAIYLSWDVSFNSGNNDLDSLLYVPYSTCILSNKAATTSCDTSAGIVTFGSRGANVKSQFNSGGNIVYTYMDTPMDSSSSSSGNGNSCPPSSTDCNVPRGYEMIFMDTLDTDTYTHFVYNAGSTSGWSGSSAQVDFWARSGSTDVDAHTVQVSSATGYSGGCTGRFWNTFTFTVTATSPLAYTFSSTNSLSVSPQISLGTTSTQSFETRSRTGTSPSPCAA